MSALGWPVENGIEIEVTRLLYIAGKGVLGGEGGCGGISGIIVTREWRGGGRPHGVSTVPKRSEATTRDRGSRSDGSCLDPFCNYNCVGYSRAISAYFIAEIFCFFSACITIELF